MTEQEIRELFDRTLDDQHLSRGERKALHEIFEEQRPDEQMYALWRHVAFDAARARLMHPKAIHVLEWYRDAMKLLHPPPPKARAVSEAHFGPGPSCTNRVVGLLGSTKKMVDISVFTITDDRIADAIVAAHSRKVKVRVISDDEKAFDRGSDIQRLREEGIPVRVDDSEHFMHNKFAVFDQTVLLTGSFNWTRAAALHNQENIIVTDDPKLVRAFMEAFEELWERFFR
jgi:phosphatidylserine/phosphatidylglycerophosphate/cardiolipin synthase-like enzyme